MPKLEWQEQREEGSRDGMKILTCSSAVISVISSASTQHISKFKDNWPFLFSLKGLFSHFSELTSISILEKLPAAIEQRSKTIIEYFGQHKTTGVGEVLDAYQKENGSKAICIILCLLAHFKENGIFLKANMSITCMYTHTLTLARSLFQQLFCKLLMQYHCVGNIVTQTIYSKLF